jgi:hypothetical protein
MPRREAANATKANRGSPLRLRAWPGILADRATSARGGKPLILVGAEGFEPPTYAL